MTAAMTGMEKRNQGARDLRRRLRQGVRRSAWLWPPLVAVLVFLALVGWAGLGPVPAAAAFAVLLAAMTGARLVIRQTDAAGRYGPGSADAELGSERAALAALLPDPCLIIDRQERVRYENPAAIRNFGSIQPGRPLSFLLRAPELSEAVQRALETGQEQTVSCYERVPAERWFEARVSPLDTGRTDRAAPFILILLRDLTEAQRVERMRVDFIANVSHELRTPLASLSGFIETLQGSAKDDPTARERFLEVMVQQARRMSRLIDDLMSLSRIELKAHMRPETEVNLVPILDHVVDAMMPLAREMGVELAAELPEGALPVKGDQDELAQLFQNLVHNALKYGQEGKRVEIAAKRRQRPGDKPDRITVSVRDYGPGIAEEHLPRLTERFYRVDVASSRDKGGTGLGLAIVKHILNRHRGQLAIDSAPGQGATFAVHLDAAAVAETRESH